MAKTFLGIKKGGDDRYRHVWMIDDPDTSHQQASGAKVKADTEPTYKIKPVIPPIRGKDR